MVRQESPRWAPPDSAHGRGDWFDRRMIRAAQADATPCIGEKADGAMMFDSLMAFRKIVGRHNSRVCRLDAGNHRPARSKSSSSSTVSRSPLSTSISAQAFAIVDAQGPSRQEVLDELINEKAQAARSQEIRTGDHGFRGRQCLCLDGGPYAIYSRATDPAAREVRRQRLHAQGSHQGRHCLGQIVRGRVPNGLQIGEKDILSAMDTQTRRHGRLRYTMRPVLFLIPTGSPDTFVDGRKREAEALRGRFQGCEEGITFARALKDVAVRDQVIRSSADIPAELRKVLEGIEVGRLDAARSHQVRRRDVCNLRQEGIDRPTIRRASAGQREPHCPAL